MKIAAVDAVHVRVPLTVPYVIARGRMTAFDNVVVRVRSDDGLCGYGESVPLSVSGDAGAIAATLNGPVAAAVRGADPLDVEVVVDRVLDLVGDRVDVAGGLDEAVWDLAGKASGQPVYRLLGGLRHELIRVDFTISADEPARMAERAVAVTAAGYPGVVVKVTAERVERDVARVRAVRAALAGDRTVRVDCNGGFTRDDARAFLEGIADLDIEFVEQPVAGDDLDGMRACRGVGVPISADESLNTLGDALALVRAEAADVLNVKVPKVGGLLMSKRIATVAAAAGLPVVVGGRTTLELSRHASRHFAAATAGAAGRAHEGPGPASQELADTVLTTRTLRETVTATGGYVPVEHAPGLGATVVWDAVQRYAVGGA